MSRSSATLRMPTARTPRYTVARAPQGGRLVWLVGLSALAWAYHLGMSHIPSPHDPHRFWIGNLAAPWILLPFISGWIQRSVVWSALSGVVIGVVSVFGFYQHFFFLGSFDFLDPWLVRAGVAGLIYGLLGLAWSRTHSVWIGALVAAPFVLEVGYETVRRGYLPHPYSVWVIEIAAGLVAFAFFFQRRHRRVRVTRSLRTRTW